MKKWICIALLMFSFGCSTEVDWTLEDRNPQWLVVDGWVTTAPGPHEITLTRTREYSDTSSFNPVIGANIWIEGDGVLEALTETGPGEYQTSDNFSLTEDQEYTYVIAVDGIVYEYTSRVRPGVQVTIDDLYTEGADSAVVEMNVQSSDTGIHFLVINLFVGNEEDNDTIWSPLFVGLENAESAIVDIDETGEAYLSIDFVRPNIPLTTLYRIEVHVLNDELFNYFTTLRQDNIGELYSPYPANPDPLFSNNAFGAVFNSSVFVQVFDLEE